MRKFSENIIKKSSDIEAMFARSYAKPDADEINLASYNNLVEATPELQLLI